MRRILALFIKGYQKVNPFLLPRTCRFYPTCSSYAKEAFLKYGIGRGTYLTLSRILKCHPFSNGGYDPVK